MLSDSLSRLLPRFLTLFLLSFLLLFLDTLRFLGPVKNLILNISSPVQISLYQTGAKVSDSFSFLTFWRHGYREIAYLKQRNSELLVLAQKAQKLFEENEILKKQLAQTPNFSFKLLPAKVIGFSRYLYLDKGSWEGVKIGQTVILEAFYVGKIVEVQTHRSKVLLPTDPESKISVVTTKNRSTGVLLGEYGTALKLTEVLTSSLLSTEETVETFEDMEVSGLLVGKILSVEKKESELYQKAQVLPLVEFNKLTTVFVLLD